MALKRDATDKLVSDIVREMVNWRCERCDKYFPEGQARKGLHCSHFYGRGGRSTRWFIDNCDSLCYGCHKYFERARDEYTAFKKQKLGDVRFDELTLRANKPRKYTKSDIKELRAHLRAQLKYMQRRRVDGETGILPVVDWD